MIVTLAQDVPDVNSLLNAVIRNGPFAAAIVLVCIACIVVFRMVIRPALENLMGISSTLRETALSNESAARLNNDSAKSHSHAVSELKAAQAVVEAHGRQLEKLVDRLTGHVTR